MAVYASDVSNGAVLLQNCNDNLELPVAFFSHKLNSHQRNYATIEQEVLALLTSLQHFEVYVGNYSEPTVVSSDHNPLTFVTKMKGKNQQLLRWCLSLQEYNITIKHIKGKDNIVADTLSRME